MKENEKNLSDIIADSQAENESSKDKSSPKKPFNFPLDFASKSHVRRASDHYDNLDEATANLILSPLTKGSLPSGHIVQIEISKIKQQSYANPKLGILKSNHVKKQNNDVREVNRNVKVQDSNEIAVEDDNEYCSSNCFTTKHHKCNNNNIQNSTAFIYLFDSGTNTKHVNVNPKVIIKKIQNRILSTIEATILHSFIICFSISSNFWRWFKSFIVSKRNSYT